MAMSLPVRSPHSEPYRAPRSRHRTTSASSLPPGPREVDRTDRNCPRGQAPREATGFAKDGAPQIWPRAESPGFRGAIGGADPPGFRDDGGSHGFRGAVGGRSPMGFAMTDAPTGFGG